MVQLIHGQMRPELFSFNCDMFVNAGEITCATDTCTDNTGDGDEHIVEAVKEN